VAVVVTGADVDAPAADVELVEEEPLEELPHAASPKHASDISSAVDIRMRLLRPMWGIILLWWLVSLGGIITHVASRAWDFCLASAVVPSLLGIIFGVMFLTGLHR
jgi:hypothetical protein